MGEGEFFHVCIPNDALRIGAAIGSKAMHFRVCAYCRANSYESILLETAVHRPYRMVCSEVLRRTWRVVSEHLLGSVDGVRTPLTACVLARTGGQGILGTEAIRLTKKNTAAGTCFDRASCGLTACSSGDSSQGKFRAQQVD